MLFWTMANISRTAGLFAYGFLLGSYGFASFATVAITDMLMSFLLFSAYCIAYPATITRAPPGRAILAGILLGLAVLTKAAFLVAAPWYVLAAREYGEQFINVVFAENLGHAFSAASTYGTGPPHGISFIPIRLIRAALPSAFMLIPLGVAAVLGCIHQSARKPLLFHLSMVIAVTLFFSFVHSVQSYYVLPALPGLAIVVSSVFAMRPEPGDRKYIVAGRVLDATLAAIAVTILALVMVSWWYCAHGGNLKPLGFRPYSDDWLLAAVYSRGMASPQGPFLLLILATAFGALLTFGGLMLRRQDWAGAGVVALSIAGTTFLRHHPFHDIYGRGELRPDLAPLKRALDLGLPAYVVLREHEQSYLRRGEPPSLRGVLSAPPGVFGKPVLFMIAPDQANSFAAEPPLKFRSRSSD